ncbi:hypothetical protein [Leuconostoc citreum]|uniref:hypothetical protein n=1 Tax=Leuconostoc citreum TaxID=33964 RepID=UPI0032DF0E64
MRAQDEVYLAVDYYNESILFWADTSGGLRQKILSAIEKGTLASDGAVRMYRTSQQNYQLIQKAINDYGIVFHEAAIPREV